MADAFLFKTYYEQQDGNGHTTTKKWQALLGDSELMS